MKNVAAVVTSLVLAGLLTATPSFAQRGGRPAGPAYDAQTVETITGTVERVERVARRRARTAGVHLVVKTDKESVPVRLGPARYVDEQKPKIERGDHVEVTGSRVTVAGKPTLIAAEVKKGDAVLHLRERTTGVPRWGGHGRR